MIDKIGPVRNPLTVIAIFATLSEVSGTVILPFISIENQNIFVWFLIIFPILLICLFFITLNFNHKVLYAPSDYKNEDNFVNTFVRKNKEVSSDLEKVNVQLKSLLTDKNPDLNKSINKISHEIEKIKEKSEKIPINNLWWLNHWGSNCASIVGDKMIFTGTSVQTPQGTDGSHLDLNYILEIGKTYEISCFAKSDTGTTGMFQLWCHDDTGVKPDGVNVLTPYKIPSAEGEKIKLNFKADYNKSIRIHLQYTPGQGRIEISDVRISELKI